MPLYQYTATDHRGKQVSGLVDAASQAVAYQKVKDRGLYPIAVNVDLSSSNKAAGTESLAYSLEQLSALIRSGIPLDEALDSLAEFDEDPRIRSALKRVRVRLREGDSLTGAMAEEQAFPPMLVRMVQAGEESGKPAEILGRYAEYLKRDIEHRRALVGALSYPVALITLSVALLFGLLYFLTPVLKEMYGALEIELPSLTRWIIWVGDSLSGFGLLVLVAAVVALIGAYRMMPRVAVDRWRLSLPLLGPMLRCGLMEQWARTLGMLHEAGVPLVRAMQLSRESCENEALNRELETAEKSVERGDGLAVSVGRIYLVPPLLQQFLKTGERTGELGPMLMSAASFYERELERRRSIMVKWLEPGLILVMGVMVGTLVLSVLLPLAEVSSRMMP
ncbi:MAG: type II secretion system F family protein [Candidatus Eremiobacteraeota bacterium]|nr:type II secretion system F family protein [Candidatus Eremiobacteraeota bacterium]